MEKKPDGDGPGKADFSAYWALKIRQMFDNRRKYLQEIDMKGIPESEWAKKFEQKAQGNLEEIQALEEEQREIKRMKLQARRQLQEEASKGREQLVMKADKGATSLSLPTLEEASDVIERDIQSARDNLRSAAVWSLPLTAHRASALVRAVLLFPINLIKAMRQQWVALFNSQRYENFLMAEGERIWYWRNRTENERWFWEIIVWERLLLPILCTVSYMKLVPDHFFWALVVPLTFIIMQSGGELPSWTSLEFWLIAYFGFYIKCWPQLSVMLRQALWV